MIFYCLNYKLEGNWWKFLAFISVCKETLLEFYLYQNLSFIP